MPKRNTRYSKKRGADNAVENNPNDGCSGKDMSSLENVSASPGQAQAKYGNTLPQTKQWLFELHDRSSNGKLTVCLVCRESFLDEDCNLNLFLCVGCSECFVSCSDLENHKCKKSREVFICTTCSQCFTSEKILQEHMVSHSNLQYYCSGCCKYFTNINALQMHTCEKEFEDSADLLIPEGKDPIKEEINIHTTFIDAKSSNQREAIYENTENSPYFHMNNKVFLKLESDETFSQTFDLHHDTCENDDAASDISSDINSSNEHDEAKQYLLTDHADLYNSSTSDIRKSFEQKSLSVEKQGEPIDSQILTEDRPEKVTVDTDEQFVGQEEHGDHTEEVSVNEDKNVINDDEVGDQSAFFVSRDEQGDQTAKEIKTFVCTECNKVFFSKKELRIHAQFHNKERPFFCHLCKDRFTANCSLKRHLRQLHNVGGSRQQLKTKRYLCPVCGKGCCDPGELQRHSYSHTGEKPYSCDFCTQRFVSAGTARRHMRDLHDPEASPRQVIKAYLCELCSKSFRSQCDLATHLASHQGVKMHTCPLCAKSFTWPNTLTKHLRTKHEGKPYKQPQKKHQCPHCDKKFPYEGQLKTHVRIHVDDKPFSCPHCSKSCAQESNMKRHIRLMHTE